MSDHWRSLAEDIGAEVTEPEKQPERTAERAAESPPPPGPPARVPRKRAAPKPKNHWQKIAGALGISVDKSAPESESTDVESPVAAEPQATEGIASEGTTADAEAATTASDLVKETPPAQQRHSAFSFDEKPTFDTPSDVSSEGAGGESAAPNDLEADADDYSTRSSRAESTPDYDPEHAKRELAALFADPVDTDAPAAEIGFSPGESVAPSDEQTSSFATEDEAAQFGGSPASEPREEIDEFQGEQREGRRPRRRRGGRRRRRKDDQPTSTRSEPELSTTSVDADVRTSDVDDSLPPAKDAESGVADDGHARRGHRKIPSWQDAVGAIVDANLKSRRNNPSSGANQGGRRRRGSGRGRRRPPQQR